MYPQGGDSISIFINSETGLVDYRIENSGGMAVFTVSGDYREVDGLLVPFYSESTILNTPQKIISQIDSIEVNPNIPDSIFAVPGERLFEYHFPDSVNKMEIPFIYKNGHIYIELKINGQGPFLFMLDSGAGYNLVSKRIAESVGLEIAGALPARGIGGFNNVNFAAIDSIHTDEFSIYLKKISVIEFDPAYASIFAEIDGILGYGLLSRFPFAIDFENRLFTLYDPAEEISTEDFEEVDMEIYYQLPVIETYVEGIPTRLIIDLGAQTGLFILGHARCFEGIEDKIDESAARYWVAGIGGKEQVIKTHIDSIRVGSQIINNPSAIIATTESVLPFPKYIEGIMGLEILQNFNILLNYQTEKAYFRLRN